MAEMSHPEAEEQAEAEGLTQANEPKDPRPVYEVGFHVLSTVDEPKVAAVVERLHTELGKGGADVISEQFPARTQLTYIIERAVSGKREKYRETYFGWIKFAIEREHIQAFEEVLRNTQEILRFILVETVREETAQRRAVFTSDRLEGETIKKRPAVREESREPISEEELDKSIEEALTQ
jgi:ribosomal protein S6